MKKVGIYNPHINTMGGGEKVALAIAEYLSRDYKVYIIVRDKIKLNKLGEYFSVNLEKTKPVLLKRDSFIVRVLTSPKLRLPGRLKEIIASRNDYRLLKKLNLDIFINSYYQSNCKSPAPISIYICMFPQKLKNVIQKKGIVASAYHFSMNIIERLSGINRKDSINSYSLILANSEYTKMWIKEYWGKDAQILFPVCDNMGPPFEEKEKIILNVGRLFASTKDNHHKCQDILLDQFKAMTSLHQKGWQLHFAGSTAKDHDSLAYTVKLIESARGYPVFFHLNVSYAELRNLYRKSAIYWHATGYGKDPHKKPETQEHFGITTVEAMSAGVVPVVIDSAGQKETVINGENGYLWGDLQEMKKHTILLASDSNKRARMSRLAIKSSQKFGKEAFNSQMEKVMRETAE